MECLTIHRAIYEARAVVALQKAMREDDILMQDRLSKVNGYLERFYLNA